MRVAQIGCGGRGNGLAKQFAGIENVEVAYVCDPDSRRAGTTRQALGNNSQAVQDFRIALDDKSVEAVIVATPDHWHAPAALLALEAGKHVYVEKPCSHNVREGRLLVESARRNKLVVQHGTQSRSSSFIARGIELLRDETSPVESKTELSRPVLLGGIRFDWGLKAIFVVSFLMAKSGTEFLLWIFLLLSASWCFFVE